MIIFVSLLFYQENYKIFISQFPKVKNDENGNYLTRYLSSKSYTDLAKEYDLVSDDNSFNYLCDKDSSKFQYRYGLYNMDEDRYTGFITEVFKHYAIGYFKKSDYDLILFSKFSDKSEKYILRTFSVRGDLLDELIINEYKYENTGISPEFFRFSLINQDLIKVFTYDDMENIILKDGKPTFSTKVLIEDYEIDSLGKFKKVAVDTVSLHKSLTTYTRFDLEPEIDDPVYKYWTLW